MRASLRANVNLCWLDARHSIRIEFRNGIGRPLPEYVSFPFSLSQKIHDSLYFMTFLASNFPRGLLILLFARHCYTWNKIFDGIIYFNISREIILYLLYTKNSIYNLRICCWTKSLKIHPPFFKEFSRLYFYIFPYYLKVL